MTRHALAQGGAWLSHAHIHNGNPQMITAVCPKRRMPGAMLINISGHPDNIYAIIQDELMNSVGIIVWSDDRVTVKYTVGETNNVRAILRRNFIAKVLKDYKVKFEEIPPHELQHEIGMIFIEIGRNLITKEFMK